MTTPSTIADMVGLTMKRIAGATVGSEEIRFRTSCGREFVFWYEHDCCASCNVEDIAGDIDDLVGSPLVMAEEVASLDGFDEKTGKSGDYEEESFTWTFYKFATVKGYVTVRWYGSSNGYYSESVSFREVGNGGDYPWRHDGERVEPEADDVAREVSQ